MLPFTLSFLDDVVPDNYRLPVTASVSGGNTAAPNIYRPLYKDWEIQKFVNSNRLDAFGKDGAEVVVTPQEEGGNPYLDDLTYVDFAFIVNKYTNDQCSLADLRDARSVTLTDTLPTYTDRNGVSRIAVFDADQNPGWTLMAELSNSVALTAIPSGEAPGETHPEADDPLRFRLTTDPTTQGKFAKGAEKGDIYDVEVYKTNPYPWSLALSNGKSQPLRHIVIQDRMIVEDGEVVLAGLDEALRFVRLESVTTGASLPEGKTYADLVDHITAYYTDGTTETISALQADAHGNIAVTFDEEKVCDGYDIVFAEDYEMQASGQVRFRTVQTPTVKESNTVWARVCFAGFCVKKVNGATQAALPGAEFTLTDAAGTVVGTAVSDADGRLQFRELTEGTYTFAETKVPDGFLDTHVSVAVTITQNPVTLAYSVTFSGDHTCLGTSADPLRIENHGAYVLPKTGGRGTAAFYVPGAFLLLSAAGSAEAASPSNPQRRRRKSAGGVFRQNAGFVCIFLQSSPAYVTLFTGKTYRRHGMDRYRIIEVKQSVFADNDAAAERLRGELDAQGTYLINLMSSPGSGKTTTLLRLLPLLQRQLRVGVMEADIDSDVDADTVSRTGAKIIQLHTGGMCHLDAGMTREGLQQLDAAGLDLVILENVGNLVCPAEFDTGAHLNLMILSVPEGHDKPLKYPLIFQTCGAMIVNKIDVLPYFDFDLDKVTAFARRRNPDLEIFPISAKTGEGVEALADWLCTRIRTHKEKKKETNA